MERHTVQRMDSAVNQKVLNDWKTSVEELRDKEREVVNSLVEEGFCYQDAFAYMEEKRREFC
jgi:Mg/Co/Ni transporter MgtE